MMGHVDLSKPLIEHPDNHNTDNHLLSPQSIISNSPGVNSASKTPTPASPLTSPNPQRSLAEIFSQGTNEEQEQQLAKFLQSTLNQSDSAFNLEKSGSVQSVPDEKKSGSHVLKSLLQNYGFELVMQFNESHQRRKLEERLRLEREILNSNSDKKSNEDEMETDEQKTKQDGDQQEEERAVIPELKKSHCPICQKEFSSIWVLKAHTEEVHKVVVPQDIVQKYIEDLKCGSDQEDKLPEDKDNNEESEKETDKKPEEDVAEKRQDSPQQQQEE